MKKEKVQWRNQLINFIAIIIGVYVAFYLTERSVAANGKRQARAYLTSMADDLQSDINQLTVSTDTLAYFVRVSKTLTRSIQRQRVPEDSLTEVIRSLYLIIPFIPKDNSYQSLLASGKLDAIEDFELRKRITELYHQHYGAIKITDEINNQQRIHLITPYLMENMHFRAGRLANAKALWADNMFANLAFSMQYGMRMKYQLDLVALEQAQQLQRTILAEIEK
jgi:hypothetical protein